MVCVSFPPYPLLPDELLPLIRNCELSLLDNLKEIIVLVFRLDNYIGENANLLRDRLLLCEYAESTAFDIDAVFALSSIVPLVGK